MDILNSLFTNIAPFFILLGLLIFVHELGHFLVAKYFGVRVETFSLGFGKKILSYKRGDTTYCLSLIPLGGYVKMFGDDPTAKGDVASSDRQYAFLHKPVMQRVAIVLAGPIMNLIFAVVLFTMINGIGESLPGPILGDVKEDTAAFTAGFRSGDKILSINNEPTPTWLDIRNQVEARAGKAVEFVVEREGEAQPLKLDVAISKGENENIFSSDREVGVIPGLAAESRSTLVGVRDPQSPAAKAGIQTLELITAINGEKVSYWRNLNSVLFNAISKSKEPLQIEVRNIEKDDKPENRRTVSVTVPDGWNEKTDFATWLGLEPAELYIYQIKKKSPADLAGIMARDRVLRLDGQDVNSWNDVLTKVKSFDPAKDGLTFTVLREGKEFDFKIKPEMTKLMTPKGKEERRFTVGIVSGFYPIGAEPIFHRISNPIEMLKEGVADTMKWTEFVVMSLVRLVQGEVSAKNVGGVITIGRVASHSFETGLSAFLRTMAIISINLFLLNLLPVPVLDGGHLVFYAIEAFKGAPLSMRKMEVAQQIGLMLLMFLMVFAFFNDVTNFFFSPW